MINGLFDSTVSTLGTALDLRSERQRLLTSNVVNQETPGYRAKDIDFSAELKKRIGGGVGPGVRPAAHHTTHPRHIPVVGRNGAPVPSVFERATAIESYDRNSVGVEGEMVRLSENTIMYNAAAQMLKEKFSLMMTAIKEGG